MKGMSKREKKIAYEAYLIGFRCAESFQMKPDKELTKEHIAMCVKAALRGEKVK